MGSFVNKAPTGTSQDWQEGLDREKFEAAVLYLLRGCGTPPPGLTSLVKMLWFADYWHYCEHLRPITGARYVALKEGPVIDDYRQLFEQLEEAGLIMRREVPVHGHEHNKVEFIPKLEPDEEIFSETEIEILDRVIKECGRASGSALSARTHREGPWTFIWDPTEPGRHIPYVAFRWLDNLPDEEELRTAEAMLSARPDVLSTIRLLNEGQA